MERNCEPMDKNRIEGDAEQGERAVRTVKPGVILSATERTARDGIPRTQGQRCFLRH